MTSSKPRALVLTGFGINCEIETAEALRLGGADADILHFNALQQNPKRLEDYQLLAFPGGFAFGDDIQAGRVLANKFRFKLREPLRKFVEAEKPVLGICNGFQALVQLGVLPGWGNWEERTVSLMRNASGKFEDRWVRLRTESCVCPFAQNVSILTLPVRHGEGQVVLSNSKVLERLVENRQIAFRYAGADGTQASGYPDNPNGSADDIAGLCNESGNVLGLMPHPECHVRYTHSPHWTEAPPQKQEEGGWMRQLGRTLGFSPAVPKDEGSCLPFFENLAAQAKK